MSREKPVATSPVRLAWTDVPAAATMMSRAFCNDPLIVHLLPDPTTRQARFARSVRCVLRYGLLYGEVQAASRDLEGVAVWLPPSRVDLSAWSMMRVGVGLLPVTVGPRFTFRLWSYFRHVSRLRRRLAPAPHWYLQMLAVDPSHRGSGHGSLLLRTMLAKLDREQMPCCLDTENEANVAIYERFGFRVLESSELPGAGRTCWLMLRERCD